ncbi:DUF4871 domain-containing protein [Sporosarcina sp. ACRSL]|uniref:DUF4871 domain-containing protein n=1 Tax=Sporosarcina sp. ACRSL TaxID=2918215 RepID=UPI001EF6BAD7|nr:DUF4871 domain-containing protein [Sporosarcina sp. ACRSL]MCG7346183.1 DUF4871 domain-containing protein [Sporosarcina sp. ACRSL]
MVSALRFVFLGMMLGLFVAGCEKETTINYEATPTFISEDEEFVGVEGKVGFLNGSYTANEPQKTVWHFWGEPDEINGAVRVEGTYLETGEKYPLLLNEHSFKTATWEYNNGFTQPNLGASKTMPSYVGFEKSGLWKVSVYIDSEKFGEFILEVK